MTASANRVFWSLVAVLLIAAGVIGTLVSLGHLPGTDRHVTLMTDAMSARWHTWRYWAPIVVIAAALVVAIAGAMLIRGEIRRGRGRPVGEVVFADDAPDIAVNGRTRVDGTTLRDALERDLQNDPRVTHATVRMTGHPDQPQLHLRLAVKAGAELPEVHSHVDAAIARFRTTTKLDPRVRETVIKVA
jgi:hypothetical protein